MQSEKTLCSAVLCDYQTHLDHLRSGYTGMSEALAESSLVGLHCHAVLGAVLLMLSCTPPICHLLLTACPSLSGILLRNMCFGEVFYMESKMCHWVFYREGTSHERNTS